MQTMELAKCLAARVAEQGGCVYYVGGFVRDRLLGIENKDVDVEVHGIAPSLLEEILDSLGTRLEMGSSFGVYGLKGYDLDIAMPRKEQAIGLGHRDFRVTVDPFIGTQKAAMRRDFTVNAMMENVLTGEIVDHFHGREDLAKGILRHVHDVSFPEDALRVLRGAQFAARFQLSAAPETIALCRRIDLSVLPRERVYEELRKALLKAEAPSRFFQVLREMGQLSGWFPELEALIGVEQNPRFHQEGDVWNHTMLMLDEAAKRRHLVRQPMAFMLSALTHDLGKAVSTEEINGVLHAYDHENLGLPLAEAFLKRLTGEHAVRQYVLNMVQLHTKPNIMAKRASVKAMNKLFDQSAEPEDLIHLAVCDDLASLTEQETQTCEALLMERLAVYREYMAQPCVMGADLVQAGLQPGPYFHGLLELAHKLHLAGVPKENALRQVLGEGRKYQKQAAAPVDL